MLSTSHSSAEAERHFHFISIQAPDDAKDQTTRRLARSHAVKQALENKRKRQQESGDNFRVTASKDKPRRLVSKRARTETRAASLSSLSAGALDPFQTLAVDSSRLQTLLGDCTLLLIAENCLGQAYNKWVRQS